MEGTSAGQVLAAAIRECINQGIATAAIDTQFPPAFAIVDGDGNITLANQKRVCAMQGHG